MNSEPMPVPIELSFPLVTLRLRVNICESQLLALLTSRGQVLEALDLYFERAVGTDAMEAALLGCVATLKNVSYCYNPSQVRFSLIWRTAITNRCPSFVSWNHYPSPTRFHSLLDFGRTSRLSSDWKSQQPTSHLKDFSRTFHLSSTRSSFNHSMIAEISLLTKGCCRRY